MLRRNTYYKILAISYWLPARLLMTIMLAGGLAISFCSFAQTVTITPSLIGSAGNFSTASFGSISSSVGEPMVTTLTNTVSPNVVFLTQGFQQPDSVQAFSISVSASDTVICAGSHTTLFVTPSGVGGPFTYSWAPSSSLNNPNISNPIATPSANTTYTVSVSHASSVLTDTITIKVNPTPTVSVSSTYSTICTGYTNSTTLTAASAGASGYSWSPGGQTTSSFVIGPILSSSSSTTYTVVVSNSSGCTAAGTIHINVINNPYGPPAITPATNVYCLGDSILPITATQSPTNDTIGWLNSSYNLIWYFPTYQPPQNLPVGTTTYYVVQGHLGCVSFPESVPITINSSPTISAGSAVTICPGYSAQLSATGSGSGSLSYEWFNSSDSVFYNGSNSTVSVNPDSTTFYLVTANNGNCHSLKDTVWVFVGGDCEIPLHIYHGITPNGDGSNDTWWIDGISSFPDNLVTIFNRWGDRVWEGKNYDNDKIIWKGKNQQEQPLPDGTYYYVITLNNPSGNKTFSGWVELTR